MSEEIEKIETKVVGIEQADKGPDSSRQVGLLLRGVDAAELKSILSGGGKLFVRSASTESEPAMTNQIEADRGEAREKVLPGDSKSVEALAMVRSLVTDWNNDDIHSTLVECKRIIDAALAPAAEEEK